MSFVGSPAISPSRTSTSAPPGGTPLAVGRRLDLPSGPAAVAATRVLSMRWAG